MRQYAIEKVEISWLSLNLKEGLAQGTMIQEAKAAPRYTTKSTGTGGIVRVRNPDRSGRLTITVDQESKLHQQLWAIMLADDASGAIAAPIVMSDLTSGEVFTYTNAFIADEPDEQRGSESTTFAWVFAYEAKIKIPSSGDVNVVGA